MLGSSLAELALADHPWLDEFLAAPDRAFEDFLFGYAKIPPYDGASPGDLARILFSPLSQEHPAIVALDEAVTRWLAARCFEGNFEEPPRKRERKRQATADAIRLISLVPLPGAAKSLRADVEVWLSFAHSLSLHSAVDVRAEYLSALALTQGLLAEKAQLPPFELEPLWLKICENSGSDFPSSYLSIALLGLRKLPEREMFPSERPWVTGLSRWAAIQKPTAEEFLKQWSFLKDLYPRNGRYWKRAVEQTLAQVPSKQIEEPVRLAWATSVGLDEGQSPAAPVKNSEIAKSFSISIEEVNNLLGDLDRPYAGLVDRIDTIISNRVRYTEISGDTFHLIKSAGRIAGNLIKSGPEFEREIRARKAIELSRLALHWEPNDDFSWANWRMALERIGDFASAEIVGWEAIRRFPENVKFRSQLFGMLARLSGREQEAEQLIRATIGQFPNDALCPTQLALFLTSVPGRHDEAEGIFLDTIRRFPHDPYPRSQLAEMYLADGRVREASTIVNEGEEVTEDKRTFYDIRSRIAYAEGDLVSAEAILREGLANYPGDSVIKIHLEQLVQGRPLRLRSVAYGQVSPAPENQSAAASAVTPQIQRNGRLRRIWNKIFASMPQDAELLSQHEGELLGILAEDRYSAYGNFVYEAISGKQIIKAADAPFELAFARAIRSKDADAFQRLSSQGAHRLIDIAKIYLFGDPDAVQRTALWLGHAPSNERRQDAALRSLMIMRLGVNINSADEVRAALLDIVPANDNIRLDLIDAAFIPGEFELAA